MKKYLITTRENYVVTYKCDYEVEAESKEEALENYDLLVGASNCDEIDSELSGITIDSVKEINND